MSTPLLAAAALVKGYRTSAGYVPVLSAVDLTVATAEMIAIVGASGVGKSTLLHVLGTLDRPENGTLQVAGANVMALDEPGLRAFRNRTLGFVFQFHHLLPEFTSLENVMMPLQIARTPQAEARARAAALLEKMGLSHRLEHRPAALSGGEQQRVAVARALVTRPRLLLADEPTGNLDQATGETIHALLRTLVSTEGLGVVVVTHNDALARTADRVLRLHEGRLAPA